ncbi:MAG: hypothetical protein JW915_04085 [Chitinispirillaceae bacterium]|nr:hypothetical protein [Chitinispirillaceae bacterium]
MPDKANQEEAHDTESGQGVADEGNYCQADWERVAASLRPGSSVFLSCIQKDIVRTRDHRLDEPKRQLV